MLQIILGFGHFFSSGFKAKFKDPNKYNTLNK